MRAILAPLRTKPIKYSVFWHWLTSQQPFHRSSCTNNFKTWKKRNFNIQTKRDFGTAIRNTNASLTDRNSSEPEKKAALYTNMNSITMGRGGVCGPQHVGGDPLQEVRWEVTFRQTTMLSRIFLGWKKIVSKLFCCAFTQHLSSDHDKRSTINCCSTTQRSVRLLTRVILIIALLLFNKLFKVLQIHFTIILSSKYVVKMLVKSRPLTLQVI